MNLTPQRLTELCATDPSWIVQFIAVNNPNDVADRIADVGFNRPLGLHGIMEGLQVLLDNGRANDFVHVLSVPLDLSGFNPDQVAAIYRAAGRHTTPDQLGHALAMNALRLWMDTPAPEPAGKQIENPNVTTPKPATPADEAAKKSRVMRAVLIGVGVVLLIVTVAYTIRVLRRS
jgi:hypothetical protein